MDENIRFIQVLDKLKKNGLLDDYVQAASILNTNKASISDIKSGRKKLSIEILRRMKLSYPMVSIEYIIMGVGDMFIDEKSSTPEPADVNAGNYLIEKITQQAEEIGALKERIRQLERAKDISAWDAQSSTNANVG